MAQMSAEHLEESKQAETPKEQLHEMRKSIDALIQWADELRANRESGYGREMSFFHTKLQEAKHWAGECLKQIGNDLPKEFQDKAD